MNLDRSRQRWEVEPIRWEFGYGRALGLLRSTFWTQERLRRILNVLGPIGYNPPGRYWIGAAEDVSKGRSLKSIPLQELELEGFFFARRPLTFDKLTKLMAATEGLTCETDPTSTRGGWMGDESALTAMLRLGLLGWRLPTEFEWEAMALGFTAESAYPAEELQVALEGGQRRQGRHEEWTCSLYRADMGLEASVYDSELSVRWGGFPGVMVRGWGKNCPDPRMRFSVRYSFDETTTRPIVEESLVREMEVCPLRTYLLARARRASRSSKLIKMSASGFIR